MNKVFLLSFIFISFNSYSYKTRDIITDPTVSERCRELLTKRNSKVTLKQRQGSLIKRTKRAIKLGQKGRKTIAQNLRLTLNNLKQENHLTTLQIKSLEESVVRNGCPGILYN